jgi:hypothetical protein
VVPDIAAMATLNSGNGVLPQNQGYVDLLQAAVGYEAFLKNLSIRGQTVQQSVVKANAAIAAIYPTLIYAPGPQLRQVVYTAIGNPNFNF